MTNRKIIIFAICCMAIVTASAAFAAGCQNSCNNQCGTKQCITIEASEEAKALVEKMQAGKAKTEETFKKMLEPGSPLFKRSAKQTLPKVEMKYTPAVSDCNGEDIYTISKPGYDKVIIYTHGGGFITGISAHHLEFCDRLVDLLNAKVIMPLYPLAPQVKWRTTYAMLTEVYKQALKENKPVYLFGDSAGAVLTQGLSLQLKQDNMPAAVKIVLISPPCDLTLTNKDIPEYEAKDPMLSKKLLDPCFLLWADKVELTDYHISPLNGELKGLPDMLIFMGNRDLLYPDVILLVDKLRSAGNKTKLVIGNGLPHIFPLITAPEREKSLAIVKEFIEGK